MLKQLKIHLVLLGVGVLCAGWVYSSVKHAHLRQVQLKFVELRTDELHTRRLNDKLYLTVTSYPDEEKPQFFRVPTYPATWPTRHITKITAFPLIAQTLKNNQSLTLVVGLHAQHILRWKIDEEIGVLQLLLKNEHGRLVGIWSMPNTAFTEKTEFGRSKTFEFQSQAGTRYKLSLEVHH